MSKSQTKKTISDNLELLSNKIKLEELRDNVKINEQQIVSVYIEIPLNEITNGDAIFHRICTEANHLVYEILKDEVNKIDAKIKEVE